MLTQLTAATTYGPPLFLRASWTYVSLIPFLSTFLIDRSATAAFFAFARSRDTETAEKKKPHWLKMKHLLFKDRSRRTFWSFTVKYAYKGSLVSVF